MDEVVQRPVIIFGRLPPQGRDVDVLARRDEHAAISSWLSANGYLQRGVKWAGFSLAGSDLVELVLAQDWGVRPDEIERLFDEAEAIPGTRHLRRPCAHHELLITARAVARGGGRISDSQRARAQDAGQRDPDAWSTARQRARSWHARWALELLKGRLAEPQVDLAGVRRRAMAEVVSWGAATKAGRRTLARRVSARSRRPFLVAFSGLDGSGKSSQASALSEALDDLGVDADLVWPPGHNPLFQAGDSVKKALFGALDSLGKGNEPPARRAEADGPDIEEPRPLKPMSAPVVHLLATIVTASQVLSLRHGAGRLRAAGKVIVFDRYALDSTVYIRDRWGDGRPLRVQTAILRALVRRPHCSFFLEVPPEVAYERKQDYPLAIFRARAALYSAECERMGARRLDGERPREQIFEEIAREVWTRLP